MKLRERDHGIPLVYLFMGYCGFVSKWVIWDKWDGLLLRKVQLEDVKVKKDLVVALLHQPAAKFDVECLNQIQDLTQLVLLPDPEQMKQMKQKLCRSAAEPPLDDEVKIQFLQIVNQPDLLVIPCWQSEINNIYVDGSRY